jgi:hypothetical protein
MLIANVSLVRARQVNGRRSKQQASVSMRIWRLRSVTCPIKALTKVEWRPLLYFSAVRSLGSACHWQPVHST